MSPLGSEGPYARALARRGPGLHHVAFRCPALDDALEALDGWLLHRRSLATVPAARTAWLARPGVAALLELTEGPADPGPPTVTRIVIPTRVAEATRSRLAAPLLGGLVLTGEGSAGLEIGAREHPVRALVGGLP